MKENCSKIWGDEQIGLLRQMHIFCQESAQNRRSHDQVHGSPCLTRAFGVSFGHVGIHWHANSSEFLSESGESLIMSRKAAFHRCKVINASCKQHHSASDEGHAGTCRCISELAKAEKLPKPPSSFVDKLNFSNHSSTF